MPLASTQNTIALHEKHMTRNYPRYPLSIVSGKASHLADAAGKKYLDLFAGFGAGLLGHAHPDLVAAGTKQMNKVWHVGNLLHTEPQTRLAAQIAEKGFGGRSYFCHSGSDANEAAFKLARLYGHQHPTDAGEPRYKIIATERSFHGRGFATMQATANPAVRQDYDPHLPGFDHVPFNDLEAMRNAIDEHTVAVIVEPIQGEGGVHLPGDDYLAGLRKLCDAHDLLLIFDEVWTGCGRTGKWFAHQHWDVQPDVMTLGKAIGCGLAVGVMCVDEAHGHLFDVNRLGRVPHATTLGGNCVSMAVAHRMFEVIERDGLVERAAKLGQQVVGRLNKIKKETGVIRAVRGRGLFIGIELDTDAESAWFDTAGQVVEAAMEAGLLVNATAGNVVRLAPPMNIEADDLMSGLDTLARCLTRHPAPAAG